MSKHSNEVSRLVTKCWKEHPECLNPCVSFANIGGLLMEFERLEKEYEKEVEKGFNFFKANVLLDIKISKLERVGEAAKKCVEDNDLKHEDFSGGLDQLAQALAELEKE